MIELFYMGGPLFMGILSLIALAMIAWSLIIGKNIFTRNYKEDPAQWRHKLTYIKSIGLFALITGILGQLIGLYEAFQSIEQMGGVSPAMLAGGLKVSSITTLYGIFIFLLAYLIWFALDSRLLKSSN